MSGSTVAGSNGMCTSCIAIPKTPMNPAESPGAIASRAHQCHLGLSKVASANPGRSAAITTPGWTGEVLEGHAAGSLAALSRRT